MSVICEIKHYASNLEANKIQGKCFKIIKITYHLIVKWLTNGKLPHSGFLPCGFCFRG